MNRGYSLVEVMVGLLVGLISMGSMIIITRAQVTHDIRNKERFRSLSSLEMASDELEEMLSSREKRFWTEFPIHSDILHPFENQLADLGFHPECPDEFESGCLVFLDVIPAQELFVLQVVTADLPDNMVLKPKDSTQPGWLSEARAMSVLFVSDGKTEFFCLVDSVEEDMVLVAPRSCQPWVIPDIALESGAEAVLIGLLTVTHVGLKPATGAGSILTFRPLILSEGTWAKARSHSSFQNLAGITLNQQGEFGPELELEPLILASDPWEVPHVSIQ